MNYEICNLSRLRTKALQGRSRHGCGNRLPEVRQNDVCAHRQDRNAGKRKSNNKTNSMQRCGVRGNVKDKKLAQTNNRIISGQHCVKTV